MSDLRTAAQQALKVLEAGTDVDPIFAGETEVALRAALVEPVKPVAQVHPNHLKPTDDGKPWCREVLLYSGDHNGDLSKGENYRVKLYTAPPQRKPLTEEEIERITDEHWPDFVAFTRAVERAHGIGE